MISAPFVAGLGYLVGPVWCARRIAGPRQGMPPSVTASLLGDIIGNRSYPEEEDEQTAETRLKGLRSACRRSGRRQLDGDGCCRRICAVRATRRPPS